MTSTAFLGRLGEPRIRILGHLNVTERTTVFCLPVVNKCVYICSNYVRHLLSRAIQQAWIGLHPELEN